jgi:hypothetical protein
MHTSFFIRFGSDNHNTLGKSYKWGKTIMMTMRGRRGGGQVVVVVVVLLTKVLQSHGTKTVVASIVRRLARQKEPTQNCNCVDCDNKHTIRPRKNLNTKIK